MEMQEYINSTKWYLLQAGGVDNWTWYGESINDWEEQTGCECETDEDILNALENGGVDNWEWYCESLEGFWEWKDHVKEKWGTKELLDFDTFKATVWKDEDEDDED